MIKIYSITINGKWCEIDTPMDLERARKNSIIAKNLIFHRD